MISLMDEIITVDTAAVHVAGAIGHPNVTLLLPYWSSWRWLAKPYPQIKICQQASAGDWESALVQL
jgi:ADP-heptose:LPS heptosyltransferase